MRKQILLLLLMLLTSASYAQTAVVHEDGNVNVDGKIYSELTSKNAGTWSFSLIINRTLTIRFPAGYHLSAIITRADYDIAYDGGLLLIATGDDEELYVEYYKGEENNLYGGIIIMLIIVLLAFLVLILLLFRIKTIDREELSKLERTLNEREILILKKIINEGGRINQNKLAKITNIPKASLSRIIRNLTHKRILIKTSRGLVNRIEFHKDFLYNHSILFQIKNIIRSKLKSFKVKN